MLELTAPVNFIHAGENRLRTRPPGSRVNEQRRAIVNAKNDLALRERLDAQINAEQPLGQPTPPSVVEDLARDPQPSADILVRKAAHRVLVHYLPGAQLPDELWKLRAMLDAHMFGRDRRVRRDEVVEVARQIDRIMPA